MGYTFDMDSYSDLHKDTYGFRPRYEWDRFYRPETTDDERQKMWDNLIEAHSLEMDREEAREKQAIADFEALVVTTMGYGAPDRETAIRWIVDGYDDPYDAGYVCYRLGIPYSFETEIAQAIG